MVTGQPYFFFLGKKVIKKKSLWTQVSQMCFLFKSESCQNFRRNFPLMGRGPDLGPGSTQLFWAPQFPMEIIGQNSTSGLAGGPQGGRGLCTAALGVAGLHGFEKLSCSDQGLVYRCPLASNNSNTPGPHMRLAHAKSCVSSFSPPNQPRKEGTLTVPCYRPRT